MAGHPLEGDSDVQWFANEAREVFAALKTYLESRTSLSSCDARALCLEANLGMSAFTGNCIMTASVVPAPTGGSQLRISGRMGYFSRFNIGAQRRIECERTAVLAAVADLLPRPIPRACPPPAAIPPLHVDLSPTDTSQHQ